MKKFVFAILCVCLCVQPCFAVYTENDLYSNNKSLRAKIEAFNKNMELLVKDTMKLADQIAAFNKPVFEARLTRKERTDTAWDEVSISPVIWNRVFAKDKTLVFGFARKDKKFFAMFMKTADPNFNFHGLRVGSKIKDIEKFFSDSINNIGHKSGNIITINGPYYGGTDYLPALVNIKIKDGIITEIHYDIGGDFSETRGGTLSRKAVNFAEQQARQMGLSSVNNALPEF